MRNGSYIIACALLCAAIMAELNAKRYHSRAARSRAKTVALSPQDQILAEKDSNAADALGNRFQIAGLSIVFLGLISWIIARVQGNRWTVVPPVILVAAYILIFLLLA